MRYPRHKCLVMRVTSNENKIVSQSEFSFLRYGLRKSSWSKLPFYQTRTGTRFLFYMMNSLKTETSEVDCQHPISQSIHWFSTGLASIELSGDPCLSNDFM